MKNVPFWTDDYPRPAALPISGLPAQADVAIIGSGCTGLNVAIVLRQAGATVAVLEQATIGWGLYNQSRTQDSAWRLSGRELYYHDCATITGFAAMLSPHGRMFFDSKHFLNYFRLTPDGRMLFGERHNLSAQLDDKESAHLLQKRMIEVFPLLADAPLSHSWTGKLGLTFDLLPPIGRTAGDRIDGVYYAYGYAGHGVAVASLVGKELGEVLAGRRVDNIFARRPQQRYFFTPYERFYLPFVSAWFRFLDLVV